MGEYDVAIERMAVVDAGMFENLVRDKVAIVSIELATTAPTLQRVAHVEASDVSS